MTQNLAKNIIVVEMFDDWPDYFRFGRTRSKSECVRKTRYEIGYSYLDTAAVCWGILDPWGWGNSCKDYGDCRLQTALAATT